MVIDPLVIKATLFGFSLILFATVWNALFAPKKKKDPKGIYKYFVEEYGFSANAQATVFNGFYAKHDIQLRADPPTAQFELANPKGIHLIIEKDIVTEVPDLIEVPFSGDGSVTVRCNYPLLAKEMLDGDLLEELDKRPLFSYEIDEGLLLRYPRVEDPKELEQLLKLGAKIIKAFEEVSYAHQEDGDEEGEAL